MCEFISWIELDKEVYFLQNSDLDTREGGKLLKPDVVSDLCGHGAIRAYYPELRKKGINKECIDFSTPDNFPKDIVKAIKAGKLSRIDIPLDILTPKACLKYKKACNIAWAEYKKAHNSTRAEYRKAHNAARAEYKKACNITWLECKKDHKVTRAEYNKAYDSARAEYNKVYDSAWSEYNKACNTAWSEYKKVYQSNYVGLVSVKANRVKAWR